jgi:hypothetical protein
LIINLLLQVGYGSSWIKQECLHPGSPETGGVNVGLSSLNTTSLNGEKLTAAAVKNQ